MTYAMIFDKEEVNTSKLENSNVYTVSSSIPY